MFTKYDLLNSRELRTELQKRGMKPYEGGRKWNQSYCMRKRLEEDDKKNKLSTIEHAKTPEVRYDERTGDNAQ